MLNRLGRGLIFIVGSVVGGLALAFLIVAARPDLIRRESVTSGPAALPAAIIGLAAAWCWRRPTPAPRLEALPIRSQGTTAT
jgi:hypothetical protein